MARSKYNVLQWCQQYSGFKIRQVKVKVYHLFFIDDLKSYGKNEIKWKES